jgi:hypothetical protein
VSKKITIELTVRSEDGKEHKTTWEFDECFISEEKGHTYYKKKDAKEVLNIEPNGQQRLMIKAWSNCPSWDDFQKREYKNSEAGL